MTQAARLLLRLREGPATLAQILQVPGCAAEYRRTFTDLRKEGYEIVHHRLRHCEYCSIRRQSASCPAFVLGENVYKLHTEPVRVEANGQRVWG